MQEAVPKGEGGMIAVLGSELEILEDIIYKKKNDFVKTYFLIFVT
jgi:malonyl CoA-acyl carrier protein transacylase